MPGQNVKVPIFRSSAEQKYESKPQCFLQDAGKILVSVFIANSFCNSGIISVYDWGEYSAEILKGGCLLTLNWFENSIPIYEGNFSCGFCGAHTLISWYFSAWMERFMF